MTKVKIPKQTNRNGVITPDDLFFHYGLQMTADYREFDLENLKSGSVTAGAGEAEIDRVDLLEDLNSFEVKISPLTEFARKNAVHRYHLNIDASTPHRERIPLNVKIQDGLAVIRITVDEGISATVEEAIEVTGQGIAAIEIELKENAQLRYVALNQNSMKSDVAVGRFAVAQSGAQLHWFDGQTGGNLSQSSMITVLSGRKAQSFVHGVVLAHDHQKPDVYHAMIHLAPETHSMITVKSAAAETSSIIYRGLIKLAPEAKHASAAQKEDALILSPQAAVQAVPELQIENNEVKCTHGVTSGRLNQEKLFYLLSRGFSELEARKALVMAHVMPALNGIEDQELRTRIQASVETYIEQHL